jgi:membrane protease YdiL (CAAX protease family)
VWIVVALVAPLATHLAAIALYAVVIGPPAQWFHPPVTPEHAAALVVFSIGEEFGWRGFLQPRLAARYGVIGGSLRVGLVWGVWHLAYSVTPETGSFDPMTLLFLLIKLPLWSVIIAWMMTRARGSLAVALAVHAGGHIDNLQRALPMDLGLHGLHMLVLALLAVAAARSLADAPRAAATATA